MVSGLNVSWFTSISRSCLIFLVHWFVIFPTPGCAPGTVGSGLSTLFSPRTAQENGDFS